MFMKSNQLRRSTGNIEAFLGEFELLKASYWKMNTHIIQNMMQEICFRLQEHSSIQAVWSIIAFSVISFHFFEYRRFSIY